MTASLEQNHYIVSERDCLPANAMEMTEVVRKMGRELGEKLKNGCLGFC